MMVLYMNDAQHHARVGALNILIVVSNLAYKTSAEYIKIEIIAEKKIHRKSVREKKQGAGNPRRNCTGEKNEEVLPQICI